MIKFLIILGQIFPTGFAWFFFYINIFILMKIENVEVQSISQAYGTPVYVYSLAELRRSIAEIRPLAQVVRYAMKACSNRSILKEMKAKG